MVIQSKLSVPIPIMSVPDFVFKSSDATLPESPVFISAEDPERVLSLSSYRYLSRRLAAGLKASGVKEGDRVLLASHNTIYNAVVFMGTVMAGAIFVGLQASYSVADIAGQLEQTDPKVILAIEAFMPKLVEARRVAFQECKEIHLFDECLHGGPSHWTKLVLSERVAQDFVWESFDTKDAATRTASVIYSSGTTGLPKGVEISHYQLIASIVQSRYTMPQGYFAHLSASAVLCYMSMSQVVGQTFACIDFSSQNLPIVIPNRSDFVSIMENISKFQVASLFINPSFLVAMNKRPDMRERLEEISSLRLLVPLGSPVDYGQYKDFINRWSMELGRTLLTFQLYGMTELAGGAVMTSLESEDGEALLFANMEAKVVDFNGEEEVHVGTEGELCIRGPNVAKGYWKNPEATEKSFVKDGWLRTGDVATINESGNLSILGRANDVIKVGDQIIIPLHTERVLLRHPEVQEAVVYGVWEQANGEASPSQNIRAYIVKAKGSDLTAQDVDKFLAQQAPALQSLSGGAVFLEIITKATNYKPNKRLLLEHRPSIPAVENGQPQPQTALH